MRSPKLPGLCCGRHSKVSLYFDERDTCYFIKFVLEMNCGEVEGGNTNGHHDLHIANIHPVFKKQILKSKNAPQIVTCGGKFGALRSKSLV